MLWPGRVPRASVRPSAGAPCVGTGDTGRGVQQPVAQRRGLGAVQHGLVVEQHRLGQGKQVRGDQRSSSQTRLMWLYREGRYPMPVSFPVRIRSSTRACARCRASEERQLPAGRVGGEGLVAVAVADLEGVQGRTGVPQFPAHARSPASQGRSSTSGSGPATRHLDHVGLFPQATVGVVRGRLVVRL